MLIKPRKALHPLTTAAFVYTPERKMSSLLSSANKFGGEGAMIPGKHWAFAGQTSKAWVSRGSATFFLTLELEPLCGKADTMSLSEVSSALSSMT